MATLLKIDVSPRGDYSVSRKLGVDWLEKWQAKNPGATIVKRDLSTDPLPFVDMPWIMGAFTAPETHTDEHKAAIKVSDDLVAELLSADEVLITTPMYNFQAPAALIAWIDHIVRLGKTFSASYEGLAKGKKVTVIVASGGNYAPGSGMEGMDFLSPYLKFIFGFIGVTDLHIKFGYGTNGINTGTISFEDFVKKNAISLD